MAKSTDPAYPIWLKVFTGIIALTCITLFVLGILAHKAGILMNLSFLALMVGFLVLLVFRLPFLISKNIQWDFWKNPFLAGNRRQWLHILPRLGFVAMLIWTCSLSFIPAQFSPDQLLSLKIISVFGPVIMVAVFLVPKRVGQWPMTLFSFAAIAALGLVIARVLVPSLDSAGYVVVDAPIAGRSLMVQAGNDNLVNYHVAHRSQKHAFDIIVPQKDGREYRGEPFENNPCFATELLAPVDGEIVAVEKTLPDQGKGETDRKNPAGNHIVIKIDDSHYALLAHMKHDSALVSPGDRVVIGQRLGYCGNSGNTSAPHLHFQVQRYPDLFAKGGFTYPVRFRNVARIRNGKAENRAPLYFRRNDIMDQSDPRSE